MASSGTSLPPPPSSATAPGQQMYDQNQGNGTHMPPPPVPPLNIPQNNNPLPTAMSAGGGQMMSPTSAAGSVRRAAPEPNKRALYIGGLDPRVTEEVLKQIFETTGHVQSVKIIPDKNVSELPWYAVFGYVTSLFSGVEWLVLQPVHLRRAVQCQASHLTLPFT